MHKVGLRLFTYLVVVLVCAIGVVGQAVEPAIEEAYLARAGGDGRAGEQATEFLTTDVPIYCVVLLDQSSGVTVKMHFVAVKVNGVKPETKVVTASYTTKNGQNRVSFTGTPDGTWTPGHYRVDLFVNGKSSRSLELEIKPLKNIAAAGFLTPAPAKSPAKRSLKKPE